MIDDSSLTIRTPDTYHMLDSLFEKKIKNSEFLELTLKAFEIESILKEQQLSITESLRANKNVSIFDHQILAAKKMINEFGCTGLLADEVGLGKTVEAGIIIKELITTGLIKNTLILAPPSLVPQWQDELLSKFDLDFVNQTTDERFVSCNSHDFLIMSHASAIQPLCQKQLNELTWDLVVVDEAHSMKNSDTQKHKLVKKLAKKRLLLLSATPIQNNLKELYNIIELLNPLIFGTWSDFKRKFVHGNDVRKINPGTRLILQDLISGLIIRNTRKEVSSYIDFSNRLPNNHILSPSDSEKTLYSSITEKLKELYSSQFSIMVVMQYQKYISSSTESTKRALYKMKQSELISNDEYFEFLSIANKIKLDSKMKHILNIIRNDDSKFLIFCEFLATQEYISKVLKENGFSTVLFNGQMNADEKIHAVNMFKDKTQVMISTGAGGEGQNFQFCHNIINYDLPWNPMRVEQRIGRVHRIGQKKDVVIHNYALSGTIEAYILELLFAKIQLFTLTLGELDVMFEGVSSTDITKKFFQEYITSIDENEAKNKFSVLSDEWQKNKNHVLTAVNSFNKNVFENFDLGSLKNE